MIEEWRQYKDTIYYVSNTGFIRNSTTGKILSPTKTRQGYLRFALWHLGRSKTVAVHRIVAEAFLTIEDGKDIVNHIDGNPSNNRLENLEYTTISGNIQHAFDIGLAARGEDCTISKLTEKEVREIINCLESNQTVSQTAKQFGVSAAAVSNIWNCNTGKHIAREKPKTKRYFSKLKATDIPTIRQMFVDGYTDLQIARKYGLSASNSIRQIRIGNNWSNY